MPSCHARSLVPASLAVLLHVGSADSSALASPDWNPVRHSHGATEPGASRAWCGTGAVEVDRTVASQRPPGAQPKSHGTGPRVTLRDGIAVIEADDSLLAIDSVFDLHGRTLHFAPDGDGWSLTSEPLAGYEPDVGTPLFAGAVDWTSVQLPLATFRFPFGSRTVDRVEVTSTFLLAFEEPRRWRKGQLEGADFLEDLGARVAVLQQARWGWGVEAHAREESDRLVVTWRSSGAPGDVDVQAILRSRAS